MIAPKLGFAWHRANDCRVRADLDDANTGRIEFVRFDKVRSHASADRDNTTSTPQPVTLRTPQ
jgi:hypothetical protein